MAIHVMETCFVKPITPTKRQILALCGLDLYWSAYGFGCIVNFYATQAGQDVQFASIISSLKHSLSVLLVDFYPLAGRLAEDPTGRLTLLDCNDSGVEFVEAHSDIPFSQLEGMDFAVQDFFPSLTARRGDRVSKDEPILSVQVTSFPGGVAMAYSVDHMFFDGFCFALLTKGWADCCKGVPLSSPPCHMRRVVSQDSPPIPRDHLQMISRSSAADIMPLPCSTAASQQGAATKMKEAVEPRLVPLTTDMVEKLKLEARSGANMTSVPFTTFECLAAYLWKARTKANEEQSEDAPVRLLIRVNVRPRLDPKLPEAYFGPAIIHAEVAGVKAGELRRESLGATAARVQEAISTYTKPEKIREEIERYESGRAVYGIQDGKQKEVVVTEIVDIRRVHFYDAEFDWGELRAVRPATTKDNGVFSLAPPLPRAGEGRGHSMQVILRLTATEMERLLPRLFVDE